MLSLSFSILLFALSISQLLFVVYADTTQFVTSASIPSLNFTSDCVNALTANVSCNAYVRRFQPGSYFQERGLEASCTSACDSALSQWQASVASACKNQVYSTDANSSTSVMVIPETVLSNYQLACVQADGDVFCNALAKNASLYGVNGTSGISPCDDCFIKQLQVQVDSPIYGGWHLQSMYSSMTASCHKTSFPISTSWSSVAKPTSTSGPSPTCTGKVYQIKSGDTCQSISLSQGIGTNWLLTDNSLPAYCSKFPTSGSLCLVNTCEVYTVQAKDTCQSISSSRNITLPQLLSWNPVLGISCASLSRSVGSQLCVTSPGTPYNGTIVSGASGVLPTSTAAPVPQNIANGTNTKCAEYYLVQPGDYCNLLTIKFAISLDDFRFLNPSINANCTNLLALESYCVEPVGNRYIPPPSSYSTIPWTSFPKATFVPNVNVTQIKPLAPNTRLDCVLYVDGAEQGVDSSAANACQYIADGWDITLDQLTNWNPSLNGSDPSCRFDTNYRYCVQAFQAAQASSTTPSDPLATWPIRDNSWTNCSTYTVVARGETCQDVIDSYEITTSQFYNWNPAVGSQCQNLWSNYRYCVRLGDYVPQSSSTGLTNIAPTSTSSLVTSASPTPPAQTQSGEPKDCQKWIVVKAGDTCDSIEKAAGISATTFLQLNPSVGSDCSGLWAGYAYCILTASSSGPTSSGPTSSVSSTPPAQTQQGEPSKCSKWVVAQKGDTCQSIEKAAGISSATFLQLNPPVKSDCSGLWLNYAYCVAA